jgi:hypothetical protein
MGRKRRLVKIPTREDFESYRGRHTFKKWRTLPAGWCCPACGRTPFELLTWTQSKTGYGVPVGEYQWLAPLHEHHDHRIDGYAIAPRFAATLICSDCNHAEGRAKRRLCLPKWFSFSPAELRLFVTGSPHNGVTIDLNRTQEIYARLLPSLIPPTPVPRAW